VAVVISIGSKPKGKEDPPSPVPMAKAWEFMKARQPPFHPAAAKYFAQTDRPARLKDVAQQIAPEMIGEEGWNPEDYEEELGETGGIEDKLNQMRMRAAERRGKVRRQSTGVGPRGERAPRFEAYHDSDFPQENKTLEPYTGRDWRKELGMRAAERDYDGQ
jgi:hypothetical protein